MTVEPTGYVDGMYHLTIEQYERALRRALEDGRAAALREVAEEVRALREANVSPAGLIYQSDVLDILGQGRHPGRGERHRERSVRDGEPMSDDPGAQHDDGSPWVDSRDTEIERLRAERETNWHSHPTCPECADMVLRLRAAERSQPATTWAAPTSAPSLDPETLHRAVADIWPMAEAPDGRTVFLEATPIDLDYDDLAERLSQPADNEAAE